MIPSQLLSTVVSSSWHIHVAGAGAGIVAFPAKYGLDVLLYRHGMPERMMMFINSTICSLFVAAVVVIVLHWVRHSRELIRTHLRHVHSLNDSVRNQLQKLLCLSALTTEDIVVVHIMGEATSEIVKALEQILPVVDERHHTQALPTTAERRTI